MFGYVQINQPELKLKDYEVYRSYYCGLCHELKKRYGRNGQMLLNYDMTFLSLLLSGLYEPEEELSKRRCIPHPAVRHSEVSSAVTGYAADMTVLLAYQKALDDWRDDHSHAKRVLAMLLYRDYKRLRGEYPRQARVLERSVRELSALEKAGEKDLDRVSALTGAFLGELFVWQEDLWQDNLKDMGFYLGKFIYLMDAFDDLKKDQKKHSYNLLLPLYEQDPDRFDERVRELLEDMMARCARSFEQLPVLKNAELIRNILYSGVWVRFAAAYTGRRKERSVAGA